MKTLRNIILISFIAIFLIPVRSFTQTIKPEEYNTWSVGVKYGILPFYGDVRQLKYSTDNKYRKTNTGFALEGIKNFNETFSAKLQMMRGRLYGSSPNLNLHFKSSVFEGSLSGVVNLNNLISYYPKKEKIINTYLFAGFGIIKYRSAVRSYDEDTFITGYAWDSLGYSRTTLKSALSFPFGIGIKFKADTKFDIGLELSLHLTNTDKLDAWVVENSYNDRFSYAAISFTYKLGDKKEYVDWVNPFHDTAKVTVLLAQNITQNIDTAGNSKKTRTNPKTSSTINKNTNKKEVVKNFFIVADSLSSEKQGEARISFLKSIGFPEAELISNNEAGNWFICYKRYATKEEAMNALAVIKQTKDPSAWIFEKKH